jgi:hypothetical protein
MVQEKLLGEDNRMIMDMIDREERPWKRVKH